MALFKNSSCHLMCIFLFRCWYLIIFFLSQVKINFEKSNDLLSSLKADNDTIYMKVNAELEHSQKHSLHQIISRYANIRHRYPLYDVIFQLACSLETDPEMIFLTTFMLGNIFSEYIARYFHIWRHSIS